MWKISRTNRQKWFCPQCYKNTPPENADDGGRYICKICGTHMFIPDLAEIDMKYGADIEKKYGITTSELICILRYSKKY